MSAFKQIIIGLVAGAAFVCSHAQTKLPPAWQSSLVRISEEGILTYIPDKDGNTIPDFSRVGYYHGDKSIPRYPVVKVVSPVKEGDSGALIQEAVDEISRRQPDENGHRGTILLKRGVYRIAGSVVINTSGIVLMGEGDNINETRLIATGKERRTLIRVEGTGSMKEIPDTRVKITDDFVPVGTHSFRVSSTKGFKVGDRVIVYRPGTQEWIHAIKMDQIVERKGTRQWTPQEYNLAFERQITKIEGNRLFIDNPVVMQHRHPAGSQRPAQLYRAHGDHDGAPGPPLRHDSGRAPDHAVVRADAGAHHRLCGGPQRHYGSALLGADAPHR